MLKNYLKIALRNLKKDKIYTLINLSGLSIGIGVCLIIFIFLQFHIQFDLFNDKADQIYRVTTLDSGPNGDERRSANMEGALAQTLIDEIPEVEASVRMLGVGKTLITVNNENFYEDKILRSDQAIFDIFTFPFRQGNPETALSNKSSIVLTKDAAKKYFREQNPLGQEIIFNERSSYTVTGVVENPPLQSHIDFSMVINIPDSISGRSVMDWNWLRSFYTYILIDEDASSTDVSSKIPSVLEGKMSLGDTEFNLQPLKDIHLKSEIDWELQPEGIFSINYIYLFSIIGILILSIACVNYVNLATARATTRLKEVGVRKAVGAQKVNLLRQFSIEILLLTFLSALISLVLVELMLPYVNELMNLNLSSSSIWSPYFIVCFTLFISVVGLISGIYPAFILSSLKAVDILKGKGKMLSGEGLRKGLVVFQFSISMILIISTVIINKQLTYIQEKNLGLNTDQVLNISFESTKTKEIGTTFLGRLKSYSNIHSVSGSNDLPGISGSNYYLYPFEDKEQPMVARYYNIDASFLETFEIKIIAGRNFNELDAKLEEIPVIVNETTVKQMGWAPDEAINQKIDRYHVIGVVKDFHYESFEQEIRPIVMAPLGNRNPRFISARIGPSDVSATMDWVREEWGEIAKSYPLEYSFLDNTFDNLYRSQQRLGTLFTIFAIITIIIACLGLFGLMAFMAAKRTKEIGVRKVLGATIIDIMALLSKDFTKLVLIGFVIAAPISWYAMSKWLQNFAYSTNIGIGAFAISVFLAVSISLIAVGGRAFKAANVNPVESLKSE